MKSPIPAVTRSLWLRTSFVLATFVLLALGANFALRGVSADTYRKLGITERSRVGKIIKRIAPSASLSPVEKAAPFAILTVNSGGDATVGAAGCGDGCSLREAIAAAAAGDTIAFSGATTVVTLTNGELVINKNLTINGGTNGVSITRNEASPQFRIFNISSGTVSLTKLFISKGDHSGQAGGIQNSGTLTMTDCVVTENTSPQAGGIQNDGAITLTNCSINNNHSTGNGGGLVSFGTSNTLTNCTISDNQANSTGGGINTATGSLTMTNCTVASNNASGGGGGLYLGSSSPALLKNTIVANNASSGGSVEIGGNNVNSSSSYNLIGVSGTGGLTNGVNGNQVGIADAMLAGLANNGAVTLTRALLPGSPAADKGSAVAGMTTDQRGQLRPFDILSIPAASGGNNSDIGAYEAQVNCASLTLSPTSLPNGSVGTSYSQTITASGGEAPYTFSVTSGSLPSGLNLAGDGTLSGFPDTAGSYNFTITATYSFGCTGSRAYSITITPCANVKAYTVNDLGDAPDATPGNSVCATAGGVCTLRAAIEELNALSGCSNTISFSVTGTINLASALPALAATMTITGPGADVLTVQRSTAGGTPRFRVFNISSGRSVTMSGLTISNGNLINDFETGAGIQNAGTLTLTNCAITDNRLEFGNDTGLGAGIYNSGILTVTGCFIGTNHADYIRCKGAGIYNAGTATITNSTFTGNTIYHNSTQGGGLYNANGATATVNHCTFSGNETSGASFSDGGNIFSASGGTLNLKNTIVANGVASQTGPDIAGSFTSQGYNLIETTSGASFTAQATDITGQDPKLAAQANNGGTTLTMNLLPGSSAVDKGSAGLTTDQRGLSRPVDMATPSNADNGNDIGALEVRCSTITLTASLPNVPVGFTYSQQLAAAGSIAPYTFTVNTGALPSGFSLSSSGVLTGQATTATTANFTIRATDGYGCTGTQAYTLSIVNCASPTTYIVNDLGDGADATAGDGACATSGGVCTLRAAIQEINALPGCANTINFSVTGTINLSSALPSLNGFISINGPGANQLTVRRNSGTFRIFNIDVGNSANIFGLTLTNGLGDEGGAIRNAGGLIVTACALTDNDSKGTNAGGTTGKTGGGGAIFNDATGVATVTRSILNANTATGGNGEFANGGGGGGGGLGGAIFNNGGTITVTNTTIAGNTAVGGNGGSANTLCPMGPGGKGGGNGGNGANNAPGGVGGFGGGGGGGSNSFGRGLGGRFGGAGGGGAGGGCSSSAGVGGSAGGGALFNYGGTSTLVNVTIVSNTVTAGNNGAAASRGGGIYNETGTVTIKNSIVAGNSAQTAATEDCDNNSAPITTNGYNLFGSGTGNPTGGTQDQTVAGANLFTTVLGPLGYYGGTTQTYAPLTGSPVIDKGSAHTGITVDQRNKTRPVDIAGVSPAPSGNSSDIGAVEAQICSTVIIAPSSLANIDVGSAYNQTFTGSGGTGPYYFNLTSGTLPTGLSLSLAGVLSGTPTALGMYNFTITMSDDNGCATSQAYTANVVCPTITIDPPSLPNSVQGATYSQTFTATGGTGTISWSRTAGTLPGGLTLSSSTGVLSGTPNATGTFIFTITATRQYGCTGSREYTVVIGPCVNAFTVNNLGDGADAAPGNGICETATGNGQCTLRAAIQEANALPGCAPHTITVGSGTIDLATALPDLNANMTINGPGAGSLTVRRSTAGGTPDFTVITIASSRTVTLSGMTISNGRNTIGAGVRNNGILTIESCVITGNTAYSLGTGFSALSRGGGIFQSGSSTSLTLSNSTVSGNQSIAETTDTNGADAQGGGIQRTSGAITIINSTISGNTAQSVTPNGTTGTARGGGFYLSSNGTLTVTNATITGNSATGGDTANEGGGVYRDPAATGAANFKNTIIAGNDAATGPDIFGTLVSQGFNLVGKSDGGTGFTDGTNNDLVGSIALPRNALLAALGSYGGATPTHALLPGSPAINAGTDTGAPANDQRGISRPQQSVVDIGAFESRGFTLAVSAGNNQSASINASFGSALIVSVTSANGEPVNGGHVTFTVPGSGASCALANNPATIASGSASTGTVTANATVGGPYIVSASANGGATGVNFSLTNNAPNVAPTVVSITRAGANPTNAASVQFTVSFSESVTGGAGSNFTLVPGGAVTGAGIIGVTGSGMTRTVTINTGTGSGTLGLNLTDSTGIADSEGAPLSNLPFPGEVYAIDKTPPDTTITSNPSNPSNNSTATFNFTGSDTGGAGLAGFQCKLDSGAFAPCTSPKTYTGLTDGPHTFQVMAVDGAGNTDASPASFMWTVDTTAPPAPVVTAPASGSVTNDSTPLVSGTAEANSTVTVYFDGSSVGTANANASGIWSFTPTVPLSNGSHAVRARAEDAAGNVSPNSSTNTFTVDTVAPDTAITNNPSNPSNSASASFSFTGSDTGGSGVASFECKLDTGNFAPCTSPQNYSGLTDGLHTFQVRAIDNAGNVDGTPASYTWTVTLNTAPSFASVATPSRQKGTNAINSQIATVADSETAPGSLTVTITSANPSNGVTVSNIVNTAGTITADILASCGAGNAASFTLQVSDGSLTTTATLNVTVTVNTAPTLIYGNASVNAGASTSNGPTTASDNGSITGYVVQSQGTYTGTISVNASGVVSISAAAPVGSHTITIRATDNCGTTTDANFTLTVGNNLPTITAGAALSRQRGSAGTISTIATVSDGETPVGSLVVTATTVPAGLTVTSITNTAGTITANVAADCTATLGNNTVVLTVTDGNSGTATANLTVNVTANIAPTVTYANASVNAGGSTSNSPTSATDNGSITGYAVQSQGTYTGTISVNASGLVSISAAAPVGSHTITIRATDNCGATTDANFTLTVGNNLPTITAGAALSRQRGSAGTVSTIATVTDGETPVGSLVVTATTVPAGITVTSIMNSAGTITANVAADCTATLGNNTVVLIVTDGNSGTATANLTVTVTANTAPSVTYAAASVNAGGSTSNSPTSATDNGSITGYVVQSQGAYTGTISVNASGVVSISNAAPVGAHTITIRVTDNCGSTTDAMFTLTVGNNAPTITPASTLIRQQGSNGIVATIATVGDSETPVGSLVVTATTVPTGISVTSIINTAGTITANVAAGCNAAIGNNTVVLTVTDANSGTATANLIVNVIDNAAPALVYPASSIALGSSTTINPTTASDNGSITSYSIFSVTPAMTVAPTVNSSGVVSINNAGPFGSHTIIVRATDNCGTTTDASFTLNVGCGSIAIAPTTLVNGLTFVAYSETITATGGSGSYTFSLQSGTLPAGLSLAGNIITGTPTTPGASNFTLRATDTNGCFGERAYTLNIGSTGLMYYPLSRPVRLLDTRPGASANACFQPNAPIAGGNFRLQPARGTCEGITIPANATTITGHITTVQSGGGSLTLYPSDAPQPNVSNSNYLPNEILNNAFTVGLGASDGAFKLFVSSNTDVVIDVTGYYAPPSASGLYFHPLPKPIRLLETRTGFSGCQTPGAPLQTATTRTQTGVLTCDGVTIPTGALALVGNATTTNSTGNGYLTLWPADAVQPFASSSNFAAGVNRNAPFTVGLSLNGEFNIYTARTTDLVIDVMGYYSTQANDANGQGLLFNSLGAPLRLLDTRAGQPACYQPGSPMTGGTVYTQETQIPCTNLTSAARALVGNVSALNASANGYLTFWPSNATQPNVATSNYQTGRVFNRHFTVGLGNDVAFKRFAASTTDVIIDIAGFFAP